MSTTITNALWVLAADDKDDRVNFDGWHPQWVQAIMDHLQCTEEEIAGIIEVNDEDEGIWETDKYLHPGAEEKETAPYNGFVLGMMEFGSVSIKKPDHPNGAKSKTKVVPCVAVYNASPACFYVRADDVRGLPLPSYLAVDPETGLPPNTPGPGAQQESKPTSKKLLCHPGIEACMDLITAANNLMRAVYANNGGEIELMRDIFGSEVCVAVAELETVLFPVQRRPIQPAGSDPNGRCDYCGGYKHHGDHSQCKDDPFSPPASAPENDSEPKTHTCDGCKKVLPAAEVIEDPRYPGMGWFCPTCREPLFAEPDAP